MFCAYPWRESCAAKPAMWEASGPVQELPSGAVAAPWRVSVIIRLLEEPGRFPVGDDSRIMPRNQAPLLAQVEQRRPVLKTTDAALGIIRDSELWRISWTRGQRPSLLRTPAASNSACRAWPSPLAL